MNSIPNYAEQLMQMIASGKLSQVIKELQNLLKGSPAYTEIILQSARYNDVMKAIRMGTINLEDSGTEKNKIRYALIDMIRELEVGVESNPKLSAEVGAVLVEEKTGTKNIATITGDGNINVQGISGSTISLNINRPSSENTDE